MVDLVYMFQGVPDIIISMNRHTGFDYIDTTDHGFAAFEYGKGFSVVRATLTEVNGYGRRQLIVCDKGIDYKSMPTIY